MDNIALAQALKYLEKLSECEKAVAEFYRLCASYWPEEEVWAALVPQELEHAGLVLKIRDLVSASPGDFELSRPLSTAAPDAFLAAAASYHGRVAKGQADKAAALALSFDIEKSIIEARYETLLRSSDKEYADIVSRINSETAVHRELLRERVARIKFLR